MEAILNKKAGFNYFIEERYEAGMVLQGWEIKPILKRKVNIELSHIVIKDGGLFLLNANITPEKTTNKHFLDISSTRTRKLLLHKSEIMRLIGKIEQKGYTLVPIKMYKKGKFFKVEIGLAKGKKLYDKRQDIKDKDWILEQNRIMKKINSN